MKVTATNDPAVVDRWVSSHILQPKVESLDFRNSTAGNPQKAAPLPLIPIGLDCEFTAVYSRGQRPRAATVQLATRRRLLPDGRFVGEDAVLVAHLLSMEHTVSRFASAASRSFGGAVVPRSLVELFSRDGCDKVLPVGQEVQADVLLLQKALRISNPPALEAPGPVELLRELHRDRTVAVSPADSIAPAAATVSTSNGSGSGSGSNSGGNAVSAARKPGSTMLVGELTAMHFPLLAASSERARVRSLQDMAVLYSGFPRWKRKAVTMSCWDRWPLTRPQLAYAAIDAYASLDVFCSLAEVAALLHSEEVHATDAAAKRQRAKLMSTSTAAAAASLLGMKPPPAGEAAGSDSVGSDAAAGLFSSNVGLAKVLRSPYYGQAVDAALAYE